MFGGTRMRTNAPDHAVVQAHSNYFLPGSEALENIVRVVTGRYAQVALHHTSVAERAGGLVAWVLRTPTMPVRAVGRHYRGPGFRLMVNAVRFVDLGAAQTGNLVSEAVDHGERAVSWLVHRAASAD
jgi:hypothetical protein